MTHRLHISRRSVLAGMAGFAMLGGRPARALPATDVTFLFINDVHACRTRDGLSPNCREEGKTDENLLRHIRAINRIEEAIWPAEIDGAATSLRSAGEKVATPRGIVLGGDMTDDGGGQRAEPEEGYQLLQFSQRYQQGDGDDEVHFPVYAGLGNHDLDQDGPKDEVDWYRRELRDYVELNHRPGVFLKPIVPADNYDVASDCYSWNWDGLHLVAAAPLRRRHAKGSGRVRSTGWRGTSRSMPPTAGRSCSSSTTAGTHSRWNAGTRPP